ncbi:MAG: DegT/DnrJ/EryC1/StrS family aminotransferase [Acidobacteria bacterium]|nr:DegT/DnrJ/EryC1/StrS family aminotransferase [Acidobacteriota bacterium]
MIKRCVSDLALFGGPPAFTETVFVGSPHIGRREDFARRITEVLDRRWLTNDGAMVREFERQVSERLKVAFCIAVCNATTGLQIVAHALGLTGEVVVPSLTFIATAHALSWIGLKPVFCDVDPRTGTLDPARVAECITPQTTSGSSRRRSIASSHKRRISAPRLSSPRTARPTGRVSPGMTSRPPSTSRTLCHSTSPCPRSRAA